MMLVNSASEIPADEALDINIAVIKNIVGGARKYIYCTDDFVKKRSIIRIKNKDNACLPRAIVVALAHLNMKKNDLGIITTQKDMIQSEIVGRVYKGNWLIN